MTAVGSAESEKPSGRNPEHPACSVAFCPICLVVTTLGEARPELVEHLVLAGRELLLAARAVIDARLEDMEEQDPRARVQRITIE